MTSAVVELREENQRLTRRLSALTEHVQINEEKLRRFQAREVSLLGATSLPELFRGLVEETRAHFRLDAVTVALIDPAHELRHLLLNRGASFGRSDGVLFVKGRADLGPAYAALAAPFVGPYRVGPHRRLFPHVIGLESVALLPLLRKERLLGGVNFGSREPGRFTREHDTFFIERLATISAVCLENTVYRERLLLSGFTDVLTGLHNRRYVQRRLPEEVARARRSGQPLSCLYVDVDHFKRVNDTHGHSAGDRVLRELARRLRAELRVNDVAARYGGEEFTVLLPHTRIEDSIELADRIRAAVAATPITLESGAEIDATVSIGVAEARPGFPDRDMRGLGEALLAAADSALYRAKNAGRNQVMICE